MLGNVLVAGFVASAAIAAPLVDNVQQRSTCVDPLVRKAWHTLSDREKKAYLDAELCLMSTPATLGLRGARTKYDEFQSVHILQARIAHNVGQFFPFHRLYVWAHEHALRTQCHYTGAQPYWDEELSAGNVTQYLLFNSGNLGFGGNGVGDSQCIADGPFAKYINPLGPNYEIHDHCIQRQFSDLMSTGAAKDVVDGCMNKTSFLDWWPCMELLPHGAGHGGVGAQMLNPISSPGDPVFFMHHAWLDRMWARWQAMDLSVRLTEIGGRNKVYDGKFGIDPKSIPPGWAPPSQAPGSAVNWSLPADVPEPQVIGDPGNTTTLTHLMQMYGIVPNRTIAEVMNIQGDVLCYSYD